MLISVREGDYEDPLRSKEVGLGKLTLVHVDDWQRQREEAGIGTNLVSPILLPDYTRRVR